MTKVPKHLKSQFARGNQENNGLVWVFCNKLEHFFADIVNRRDHENFGFFRGSVSGSINKTLGADRVIFLAHALIRKTARWTLKWFMTIREAQHQKRVFCPFFKLFKTFKAVEKKIVLAKVSFFTKVGRQESKAVFQGSFKNIIFENARLVMVIEVFQSFPSKIFSRLSCNSRNFWQMINRLELVHDYQG